MSKISIQKCLWSAFLCDAYKVAYLLYLWSINMMLTQANVMSCNIIIATGKFIVANLSGNVVLRLSSREIDRIFAVSQADRASLFLAQHNELYANTVWILELHIQFTIQAITIYIRRDLFVFYISNIILWGVFVRSKRIPLKAKNTDFHSSAPACTTIRSESVLTIYYGTASDLFSSSFLIIINRCWCILVAFHFVCWINIPLATKFGVSYSVAIPFSIICHFHCMRFYRANYFNCNLFLVTIVIFPFGMDLCSAFVTTIYIGRCIYFCHINNTSKSTNS